jgi:hypothetical protein
MGAAVTIEGRRDRLVQSYAGADVPWTGSCSLFPEFSMESRYLVSEPS